MGFAACLNMGKGYGRQITHSPGDYQPWTAELVPLGAKAQKTNTRSRFQSCGFKEETAATTTGLLLKTNRRTKATLYRLTTLYNEL